MSVDVLKIIKDLEDNVFKKYGNPLSSYKMTQDDVHMTYYVGRLMGELKHDYIPPEKIMGEHEERVYYSERAIYDAFLAGRLIERKERSEMRKELVEEIKKELHRIIDEQF